ncbi:protein kinase domain-containing protein [Rhodopirellula halodulae]|uniref:serine/threonine-protein kinase n=1 Tax=Rhodopirellula halodulae TaxID=2894198 RepID=UPI001E58A6D9|nr:serine/threonine-protein kinase [Rhodopirellula sp. JC737]MCC9658194.1 serine/threonine-protein kinase [Rhodopirellula sp. JC737]
MSNEKQAIAEDIFFDAIELPSEKREAFLQERCGDDATLLAIVRDLIAADEAAQGDPFLQSRFMPASPLMQMRGEEFGDTSDGVPTEYEAVRETARFEILSRHEEGGLGEVLVAHDRQLDREVAIKQIRPQWNGHEEANARFLREAELTGRLEHPGIVPVYAMGTWKDGRPFYAMRFIEGKTLREVIHEHREKLTALSPSDVSSVNEPTRALRDLLNRFVDVCNTIEYAHSRRIIHRDIKPANIMIGPYGETLVVDWGLAKQLDVPEVDGQTGVTDQSIATDSSTGSGSRNGSNHTRVGGTVGTPQYMSPEQAQGRTDEVGIATDVYLLGATLYQILTGSPPHQDDSVSQILHRIEQDQIVPPRQIDSNVPEPLQAICLHAMATRPADRYSKASELAADVERWLADEPVSVFHDPLPVRMGRWGRKHRTIVTSGAVAALLLMIGSVVGAGIWSYESSRRIAVERERNLKELELRIARSNRLNEIRNAVDSAWQVATREIEVNRFESALGVLQRALVTLEDQSEMESARERIAAKASRLQQLVTFYDQAEKSEQFGIMSRDTQGIMAASAALKSLNIWHQRDWWNHLPDEDLSPLQQEQLRWDAYQQWIVLNGLLVKTIGTRLFGVMQASESNSESNDRLWKAVLAMQTKAGIAEAEASKVVSQRIDLFRQAEAVRWYRGIANFRLGEGKWVKAEELNTARNAADAQKIGMMCLLSAMDPSFRVVFQDYKHRDAVTAGLELFERSASLRPNHYWTQLTLAHMQYFSAIQQPKLDWTSYSLAIQTFGRCIAINPENCFGYADRAALYRMQTDLLRDDETLDESTRDERVEDLLLWSMQDAEKAYRLADEQPWVGWVYGMTLAAIDQNERAIDVFLETCRQSLSLVPVMDSSLVAAEDLRGRSDAVRYAERMVELHPNEPIYRTLLASIHLTRQQNELAEEVLQTLFDSQSIQQLTPRLMAHTYAVRGMIELSREAIGNAADDFEKAIMLDAHHLWAVYGSAVCHDRLRQQQNALQLYQRASKLATISEHQAACWLGIGRSQAFLKQYDEAAESIRKAVELQPGCEVVAAIRPLYEQLKQWSKASHSKDEMRQLANWIKEINELPRATRVLIANQQMDEPYHAALLNGGFEQGGWNHWANDRGIAWINSPGYQGLASITSSLSHGGDHSLRIVGDRLPDEAKATTDATIGGRTRQIFPIPENSRCVVSLWAKADGLAEDALTVVVGGSEVPVSLTLDAGTYDWKQFSTEIYFDRSPDPTLTSFAMEIQIRSQGEGEIWLDDFDVMVFDVD